MRNKIFLLFVILLVTVPVFARNTVPFAARVVDKKGNPVSGAFVCQQSNTSINTVTGKDGSFFLQVEEGGDVKISLNNGDYILTSPDVKGDIVFDSKAGIVDYGFGVGFNFMESTASVNTAYSEELSKTKTLNAINSLYGMLPGLQVMQSGGNPWNDANPSLYIRGKGTYRNAGILVLVDGLERSMNSLCLADIESISVLKDAAALALYGQRGANGVLSIKTKRGSWSGREVSVDYRHGLTRPRNLPDMADGLTYAKAVNEACLNDGIQQQFSEYDIADIANGTNPYLLPDVDWVKESLRDFGSEDNVTVQFRGGNDNVAYYAMLDYNHVSGIFKPTELNEKYSTQLKRHIINVSTRLDVRLTKSTLLSFNLTGKINQDRKPGGASHNDIFDTFYTLPATAMPVYAEDGTWGGNVLYKTDGLSSNPVAQIGGRGYVQTHNRRLSVDGTLSQDLGMVIKGLSADLRVGYDNVAEYKDNKKVNNFRYTVYSWNRDPISNEILPENINSEIYGSDALVSISSSFSHQSRHGFLQGRLNYQNNWGRHSLSAMAGYFQEKSVGDGQYSTFLHQSILGQVHYAYDRRFVADLAISYSGSNYLAPGDRFRYYPAISAGWVISNEKFMRESNVDFLKLRISYGLSGNDRISQNLFVQSYTQGGGYWFNDENHYNTGRVEEKFATEDLSPECAHTVNIGMDFSFFNRLSGTFDAFYSRRTDIMAASDNSVSEILGVTAPIICTGIVDNAGFEAGLEWNDKVGDFSYTLGAQFSLSRNRIVNMEEAFLPYDYMKSTGKRVGQPFGLASDGFFRNQDEIDKALPQNWGILHPGDIRYKDQNKDGKIDQEDVVAIGSPTEYPGMYFSFKLGFEWNGLGFDAIFQGAADYGVNLNTPGVYKGLINNTTISDYMYENAWSTERNTSARYPRLTSQKNDNNYRNNDIWLQDNPFLKLRTLNIYYRFPKRWLSKIKISDLCLYLNGNNLFSIDRLDVQDPEYTGTGYPLMSAYSLGLSFKF